MSFGFGFALPAYPLRGGGGNNPFNQLGPTLDLSFAGVVTDQSDPNGYTLNTNFIIPQYQIAAQYVVWETGVGLVDKTFSQIITFTRASTATYFDSAGVLTSAATNAPRFDYNPSTLVAQGLLIEESRTNAVTQSTAMDVNRLAAVTGGSGSFIDGETLNFSGGGSAIYVSYSSSASILALRNATGTLSGTVTGASSLATRTVTTVTESWNAAVGITRSPSAGTAPDGTVTAVKIEETAVNNEHINRQLVAGLVSGNVYTVSFFAKAAERTCGRIRILDAVTGTVGYLVNFDLATATTTSAVIGAGTVSNSFCTPVGNGWFRVGVSGSLNQTSALFDVYTLTSIGGAATYLGTAGSGYLMWGAQFETTSAAGAAPFSTSFIPTTTTALTRSADVATVNTLSPWFNATTGTLFTESQQLPGQTALVFPRIAGIDDGTTNNAILNLWRSDTSRLYGAVRVGAVDQADVGTTGITQTNVNKLGLAYATNDFAASVNGGTPSTDALGTVPSGLTTLRIGKSSGTDFLNGYLRRVTYYPRRLTNAELQQITLPTGATITTQDYSFESNFTGNTVAIGS
jgi:hypothetical protein